jgi:hypothetical protein
MMTIKRIAGQIAFSHPAEGIVGADLRAAGFGFAIYNDEGGGRIAVLPGMIDDGTRYALVWRDYTTEEHSIPAMRGLLRKFADEVDAIIQNPSTHVVTVGFAPLKPAN